MTDKPDFSIEVTYGEYKFTFTSEPQRKMTHVLVTTDENRSILVDRMVQRDAAKIGFDFYCSGIEVFTLAAVKGLLESTGENKV